MGYLSAPQAILRVEDRQGRIIWQPDAARRQVMDPSTLADPRRAA